MIFVNSTLQNCEGESIPTSLGFYSQIQYGRACKLVEISEVSLILESMSDEKVEGQ